jgi:hypothetical protein
MHETYRFSTFCPIYIASLSHCVGINLYFVYKMDISFWLSMSSTRKKFVHEKWYNYLISRWVHPTDYKFRSCLFFHWFDTNGEMCQDPHWDASAGGNNILVWRVCKFVAAWDFAHTICEWKSRGWVQDSKISLKKWFWLINLRFI